MNVQSWLPYLPIYPNSQIPQTQASSKRVVEPSTRSSVDIHAGETWVERVERLRESHRNAAVIRYDKYGGRIIPHIGTGSVLDLEV